MNPLFDTRLGRTVASACVGIVAGTTFSVVLTWLHRLVISCDVVVVERVMLAFVCLIAAPLSLYLLFKGSK